MKMNIESIEAHRLLIAARVGVLAAVIAATSVAATAPSLPFVQTLTPTNVTSSSAQLNASLSPNGSPLSGYFEFGPSSSYGNTTPVGSFGTAPLTISFTVTGLIPDTVYHYRIFGWTNAGSSTGGDVTFRTNPIASAPTSGSTVAPPSTTAPPSISTPPTNTPPSQPSTDDAVRVIVVQGQGNVTATGANLFSPITTSGELAMKAASNGLPVTLTATAATGSRFLKWQKGGTEILTTPTITVPTTTPIRIEAYFESAQSTPTTTTPTTTQPVNSSPAAPQISQPNLLGRFYTSENIFWLGGFAPATTNPPNPKLGASLGNCTWFTHGRARELGFDIAQLVAMSGNAETWDDAARAIGVRVDANPEIGAIAQSDSQKHVAMVEWVFPDGTILVSESSYVSDLSSPWNFLWRTRVVASTWFSAYIHVTKTGSAASSTGSNGTNGSGTSSSNGATNTGVSSTATGGPTSSTAVIATGTTGVTALPGAQTSRFGSISMLSLVGAGSPVACGFSIVGSVPKRVVIRVIGPTLKGFGVSAALDDPQLRLFDSSGKQIDGNDDWSGSAELISAFNSGGMFPLSPGSRDAALLVTLPPGVYTVQAVAKGDASGVVLFEVYELL